MNGNFSGIAHVVVADSHPLYRDGLAQWLGREKGVDLVAVARNGSEALDAVRQHAPDVAIVGYELPGLDGTRVAAAVRREALRTRVLVLAPALDNSLVVLRSIGSGAAGVVGRNAEPHELRDVIATVAGGGVVLPPAAMTGLAGEIRLRQLRRVPVLTAREHEVLDLVARDCTTAQVAGRLHLSAATVRTHLHRVYDKLDVSDRAAAVASAMRLGLLE